MGVCGSDLPPEAWGQAYAHMAQHIAAGDLVVALTSISAIMVATVSTLEEERAAQARRELMQQRQKMEEQGGGERGEGGVWGEEELGDVPGIGGGRGWMRMCMGNLMLSIHTCTCIVIHAPTPTHRSISRATSIPQSTHTSSGGNSSIGTGQQLCTGMYDSVLLCIVSSMPCVYTHTSVHGVVIGVTQHLLTHLTNTQPLFQNHHQVDRLDETENVVRVLQLVSIVVELIGEQVKPLLGLFATALPNIWNTSRGAANGGDGAVARLHSALMATLAHLVSRVGRTALSDPGLSSVLFPLLQYATSLGSGGEGDVLLDEALKLWAATMGSATELVPPLQELLPNLMRLLQRGKDGGAVMSILEGYLLLGQGAGMEPHLGLVSAAMQHALEHALTTLQAPAGGAGGQAGGVPRISGESANDLVVIASLMTIVQQV